MELQGFKFPDSPFKWEFEIADMRVLSNEQMLDRFLEEYKWCRRGLGFVRNPEDKEGKGYLDENADWIVIPYPKNYIITIERSFSEHFGPHTVRLLYKPYQVHGDLVWVATCQIDGFFHGDKKMRIALRAAINAGELYQSAATAKEIIIL